MSNRTPEQFAIEHGRYLATAADRFMEVCNKLALLQQKLEEGDAIEHDIDRAKDDCDEAQCALRNRIYEFLKRADRADDR